MLGHRRGPFRTLLLPGVIAAAMLPLAGLGFTADAGAAGGTAGGDSGGTEPGAVAGKGTDGAGDGGDAGKGFPAETPVGEMSPEQQAAYWKHQSRKHEQQAKDNATAARERDALKKQHQSEAEKAIEEAKAAGRTEAMHEVVEARLVAALSGRLNEDAAEELASSVNHTKFLDDAGKVDTTKIREWVEKVAPKGTSTSSTDRKKVDTGGGNRGDGTGKGSVQSGMDRYAERHARKTTSASAA